MGNFPILGNLRGSLGQNFDLLGYPKIHKSLGSLISSNYVGIGDSKQDQSYKNTEFYTTLKPFLNKLSMSNCLNYGYKVYWGRIICKAYYETSII